MQATLKNYRQAPRKVRLVADAIRNKSVEDALRTLAFMDKKSAEPLSKLLKSAVANAKGKGVAGIERLVVKRITVDKGIVFRRGIRHARRTFPMRKETSIVSVLLGEGAALKKKLKPEKSKGKN